VRSASGSALEVVNSELIATAGEFSGDVAISADKARLDLAGIRLDARRTPITVRRFTRVVGSSTEIHSPAYTGTWQRQQGDRDGRAGAVAHKAKRPARLPVRGVLQEEGG